MSVLAKKASPGSAPSSLAPDRRGWTWEEVLRALPVAIYTTDAAGRITFYNEAAFRLWGVRPEIGRSEFCGSWKLYWPNGAELPHDECPMAMALKEARSIEGMEAVAERPDGTRVSFLAYPSPLFDALGTLVGAVNMLVDIGERKSEELARQHLAAIVESSDDAIVAKDLKGVITNWNRAAQRLFGYTEHEAVGKPITLIIPADRYDEEPQILARIRRGERIDHYETIRRRKDGSLVEISLTVSPVRDQKGRIVGASKIARDITEKRRAEEHSKLLLREMNHRVRNLFSLSASLVSLSARSASSTEALASSMQERFTALARAHSLTLPTMEERANGVEKPTTLHELIRMITLPFTDQGDASSPRVTVTGPDVPISGSAVTNFALFLHEFTTNAAKYGALASSDGFVRIECAEQGDRFTLNWRECSARPNDIQPSPEGFGSILTRATITGLLGGELTREFQLGGLLIKVSIPRDRFAAGDLPAR
jgi:PAS domain S-box-containing protein